MSLTRYLPWLAGLTTAFILSIATAAAAQKEGSPQSCTIVINEFMSAKQRVIADGEGEYSDWIEFYNCSDIDIDLTGWYLSDRYDHPKQWQFPTTIVPAKGFLTLWASGKDRTDGDELHTNFRIDSSGEPLLLSNADGELIDEIPSIVVNAHETAGRFPDGVGNVAILAEPSPSGSNTKVVAPAFIDAPEFSHDAGFYDKEFTLKLSHSDEDVTIYYTLDGSEPDPENLDGRTYRYKNSYQQPPKKEGQKVEINQDFLYNEYITYQYTQPISIKDRSFEPDRISQISTTFDEQPDYFPEPQEAEHWVNDMVNQANKIVKELNFFGRKVNNLGNRAIRKYYALTTGEVLPLGNKRFVVEIPDIGYKKWKYTYKGTPVRAIAVKENNQRHTISPIATNIYFIGDKAEFSLPIVAITLAEKDLFDYDEGIFVAGKSYDEWLESEGHNHDIPMRSDNNWLSNQKKSASVVFFIGQSTYSVDDSSVRINGNWSRRYRNKSIRIYPGLNKKSLGGVPVFDDGKLLSNRRLVLRNSGNNAGNNYINDASIQSIVAGLSFGTQRYQPYLTFINGEYNGILNARDRQDIYYLQSEYNLPSQEVDHLKNNGTVVSGNADGWEEIFAIAEEGLGDSNSTSFKKNIFNLIDIDSLIDYYIAEIFIANTDWPRNNIAYWRYAGPSQDSNKATDGKWRWLMYDTDHGLGFSSRNKQGVKHNSVEYASSPEHGKSNLVFRMALVDPEFRKRFSVRFADLLNTTFNPERTEFIVRNIENNIKSAMTQHIERWGRPGSKEVWHTSIERMVDFTKKRPAIQREQLKKFFDLGELYTLSVRVLVQDEYGRTESSNNAAIIKLNTLALGVSDDELEKPVAASARATNMEKYLALPWSGEYFAGMPIELTALPRMNYRFSNWEGKNIPEVERHNPHLVLKPESDVMVTAVFVKELEN